MLFLLFLDKRILPNSYSCCCCYQGTFRVMEEQLMDVLPHLSSYFHLFTIINADTG